MNWIIYIKILYLDLFTDSFFFIHTATIEIYTLSLHDALPISRVAMAVAVGTAFGLAGALFQTVLRKDRKSTRLNSSHVAISYAVFCLKKKKKKFYKDKQLI